MLFQVLVKKTKHDVILNHFYHLFKVVVPGQTKAKMIQNSNNIFSQIIAQFKEIMRINCVIVFILQLFSHKLKVCISLFVSLITSVFTPCCFDANEYQTPLFSFALDMRFQKKASNEG